MSIDHYPEYIKNKTKYIKNKTKYINLIGGDLNPMTVKNIRQLKSNKDLRIVIGAGNKNIEGTEDFCRFHGPCDKTNDIKFNVAITNDRDMIDYDNTNFVGLCIDINEYNDTFSLGRILANQATYIIFDYSVVKFIESSGKKMPFSLFVHLFASFYP